jgi:GrpB-like predicted nucleotidyltransferase (UPF0157 family)/adenylate kinase family enzyme
MKYVFKPYSKTFPTLFQKEKQRLNVLNKFTIEHVGSTAVPGLGGKGIIDIGIGASRNKFEEIKSDLLNLGYSFRPDFSTEDRLYFAAFLPDQEIETRRYHIHVMDKGNSEWSRMLYFRDYLRAHPEALQEYTSIKKSAAQEANEEGEVYRKLKEPFIQKILDHKILFIIGASGSGKTTLLKKIEKKLPDNIQLIHFDSIEVPSFEQMREEYGSLEKWQEVKTYEWVETLQREYLYKKHIVFDAQIRPEFILQSYQRYQVPYEALLIDCEDNVRLERLKGRGNPELANQEMLNWARYLRKKSLENGIELLDTTHLSIEEGVNKVVIFIEKSLKSKI